MYSPKIDESLIPKLYHIARQREISMTKLVSELIADAIKAINVEIIPDERRLQICRPHWKNR